MSPDHSQRGSALILVLWCLLLLGMAVFGVVNMVQLSVDHTTRSQRVLEARALAASGVALGLHPQLLKDDPLLAQSPSARRQFKATISNEGARLNLNFVLLSNHRDILVVLFNRWGLKLDQANHVANCLYDWVTPGDLPSLNGAKAEQYAKAKLPQRPTGEPFNSLDEVDQVMGMELINKVKPDWKDSFTLWSNGPLNLKEAPAELIAAVFGIDTKHVTFFTENRDGKDGIPGTSDDPPFPDLKIVAAQLGVSRLIWKEFGPQVDLDDPARRVESVGQAEGTRVMISVVARMKTSPIQYLSWSEQ